MFNVNNFNFGKTVGRMAVTVFGICVLALFAGQSFVVVDAGERGVVIRLGEVVRTIGEGLHFKVPVIERTFVMSVRDEKYETKMEVSSKDVQTIAISETLVYALEPEKTGEVYRRYNTNIKEIVIVPTLAEITQSVVANYQIEEFLEKRREISDQITAQFKNEVQGTGIVVKSLLLTDHNFSKEYEKSIEEKKIAEQQALKAKSDLERAKLEAQAQSVKQKSLSALVLQERAIDKWDGHLPKYMSGKDLPFIMKPEE